MPPVGSDDALAIRFVAEYGARLRYVAKWGRWFEWDGTRWREDDTVHIFERSRVVCRAYAAELVRNTNLKGTGIAGAKTIAAVEKIARSDRRIAATVDQWDANLWLLNTPGGIIDLKTGRTIDHDPEQYQTKLVICEPAETSDCPIWHEFLNTCTCGDSELRLFLQRMAGYALTGSIQEHALFFFYGTGGNGKGVFINTIRAIMKDYATVAPIDTFIATSGNQHPTDLAGLRGARLVTAQETEEGRRWAESRIKALTGGDPVSARFMRQDFFEYNPQFKLVIAGNHKPGLRGVDAAISRRMNLVPFLANIAQEDQDQELQEKLKAEYPAILRWMIEGCIEWQGAGLQRPEAVRNATVDYLGAEDALGQWLEECCHVRATFWTPSGDLYRSWKAFCDQQGEQTGSQKRLTQTLQDRGFSMRRGGPAGTRGFDGIGIKIPTSTDQDLYER